MTGFLAALVVIVLAATGALARNNLRLNREVGLLLRRTADNSVRIWKVECAVEDDGR